MRYSRLGYWGLPTLAVAIMVLGLGVLFAMPHGMIWLKAGVWSAVGIVGATTALAAFRYADEVVLETQKTAWFWGSIGAVIAMVPLMIAMSWHLVWFPLTAWTAAHRLNFPGFYFVMGMTFLWARPRRRLHAGIHLAALAVTKTRKSAPRTRRPQGQTSRNRYRRASAAFCSPQDMARQVDAVRAQIIEALGERAP